MTETLSEAMVVYWDMGPVIQILEYVDKNDNLRKRAVHAVWKIVGILSLFQCVIASRDKRFGVILQYRHPLGAMETRQYSPVLSCLVIKGNQGTWSVRPNGLGYASASSYIKEPSNN